MYSAASYVSTLLSCQVTFLYCKTFLDLLENDIKKHANVKLPIAKLLHLDLYAKKAFSYDFMEEYSSKEFSYPVT